MKIYLMIIMTAGVLTAAAAPKNKNAEKPVRWKLEFIENFSSSRLDEKVWTRIDKGTVDWNRNMSLQMLKCSEIPRLIGYTSVHQKFAYFSPFLLGRKKRVEYAFIAPKINALSGFSTWF